MKHPRKPRRALLVALCLIPAIAFATWQIIPPGRDKFATVQVSRGDIESSVTALGTLQPRRYVDVGAQASGQIRKIHVEVGDVVKVLAIGFVFIPFGSIPYALLTRNLEVKRTSKVMAISVVAPFSST